MQTQPAPALVVMPADQLAELIAVSCQAAVASAVSAALETAVAPLREEIKKLTQTDEYVTLHQAAESRGISANTLKNYILKGRMHPRKKQVVKLNADLTAGGHYRVSTKELTQYLALFKAHREVK